MHRWQVPSFNDLNTHSADDLEEDVLCQERRAKPDQTTNAALRTSSAPIATKTSNKNDALPAIDPFVHDVHKVRRVCWLLACSHDGDIEA